MSRESWLLQAVNLARPDFEEAGSPLPEVVRVAIGRTTKKNSLGECWAPEAADDGVREIWIKPYTRDPIEIVQVLVHELAHATLPFGVAHKTPFVKLIRKLHLGGKPTATIVTDDFRSVWEPRLEQLGPYPGGVLHHGDPSGKEKKKRPASHLKFECGCGAAWWMTPKQVEAVPEMRCLSVECEEIPDVKGGEE